MSKPKYHICEKCGHMSEPEWVVKWDGFGGDPNNPYPLKPYDPDIDRHLGEGIESGALVILVVIGLIVLAVLFLSS